MLSKRSRQIRRDTIKLSKTNGGYHWGGSFSCVEILIALFDHVLTDDDKFILSKGHACWPYYVLLRERGFNPKLEGHPSRDEHNGIHCATGSMGHGFPTAVGMAMAKKIKGEGGRVFVLMGDGECQEGTTWESLLIASKQELDNLTVVIDWNKIQGSGRVSDILDFSAIHEVVNRLKWNFISVIEGHDIDKLIFGFNRFGIGEPNFMIVNTTKGRGVSFMEDRPEWHACWLDDEHEKLAMEELSCEKELVSA